MGDYVIAYTLDGEGEEVVFQHGVAVRMTVLAMVALGVLAGLVVIGQRWRRRRSSRTDSAT